MATSTTACAPDAIVAQLRSAVRALRLRGLKQATKFASELLLGVPDEIRARVAAPPSDAALADPLDDRDRYDAARASFDCGEYLRAHQQLSSAPSSGCATRFLSLYALYLAGEKAKEEMDLAMSVTTAPTPAPTPAPAAKSAADHATTREGVNPHLKELYVALLGLHNDAQQPLDAFGLYLFAVVLRRLGYTTVMGALATADASMSASFSFGPDPHDDAEGKCEDDDSDAPLTTTRAVLLASLRLFPYNWSAWMELAALSPFTTPAEELVLARASPYMFHLFQAHVLLDQQQNDAAHAVLDHLSLLFPHSTYVLAQQALTSYHMRDFDAAQSQFERLAIADPHRIDTMDVYSNVLYVKEDKTELSRLAHRALQIEKYRPETCCILGNYYSLKNKHDRAVVYFHRALKLDPNFLSAWTLIGHEYVELKNTSAAIEAYRHAVQLSKRDYRAWYGLGQAYEILNMYLYSIYYYKQAAAIRPYDARMWSALGGCYEKLGKLDDATACFERAVGNHDRENMASFHLGRLLATKHQHDRAAMYYQLHLGLRDVASLGPHRQDAVLDGIAPGAIRLDTPQALAAALFLATYYKQLGRYADATVFCNRLLDVQGPEKEEAKSMLREMRSLEAAATSMATSA
jgi:anaphase-promoting complex subunit 8